MRIFQSTNRNKNTILVVANDEERALTVSVMMNHSRKKENLTLEDITDDYVNHHGRRGFNLSTLKEGQLWQKCNGRKSEWFTTF